MSMCTGISNVMTNVKHAIFHKDYVKLSTEFDIDQNTTILAPYCQNVRLRYRYLIDNVTDGITFDSSTYWLNINTTTTININDDTQKYMNISEYFQYLYNKSLSIPNNGLFLSFESFNLIKLANIQMP